MYADGSPMPRDDAKAAALYDKGCTGGDATSCGRLAAMLRDGRGVPRDMAKAAALARKSCDAGATAACVALALALQNGEGLAGRPEAGARALHEGLRRRRAARLPGPRRARARRRRRRPRPAAGRSSCSERPATGASAPAATSAALLLGARAGRARRPGPGDLAPAPGLHRRRPARLRHARPALPVGPRRRARPEPGRPSSSTRPARRARSPGCSAHAAMLEAGDIIGRDLPRARALYEKTCAGGIAADCYALGRIVQKDAERPQARLRPVREGLRRQRGRRLPRGRRRPGTPAASR